MHRPLNVISVYIMQKTLAFVNDIKIANDYNIEIICPVLQLIAWKILFFFGSFFLDF